MADRPEPDPPLRGLAGFGVLATATLLAQLDAVHAALPVVGLLRGRLGVALLALAAGLALWRRHGPRLRVPIVSDAALFALAACLNAGLGLYYTSRLQTSGDEPEYLLMAQSLWRDGDLELQNNWEEEQFLDYIPAMPRSPFGTFRADGRPFPARSPGLPAALAPAYALGGRAACVLLLALAGAAFGVEVRRLARGLALDEPHALLAWLAAIGPPALFYSFHMYPAILGGLAVAFALRVLLGTPGPALAAAAGLAAATLPWLHTRLLPLALALGLVALARLRGRALLAFAGVAAAMALGFFAYHVAIFGAATPLGPYGGRMPRGVRRSTPLHALGGIFLDRGFGLLVYAPVFLAGLAGLPMLLKRGRAALPWLLVALAAVLPVIFWRLWFGGFCPPARFLVPLVPLLACLVSLRHAASTAGLARWTPALLLIGIAWSALLTADPQATWLLNVKEHPPLAWDWLVDPFWTERYLPNYTSLERADERVGMSWGAALVALLLLDAAARRFPAVDRLFRGPGLALALLLAAGVLIDVWAR